jgi:uncharacterized protein YbaP (TraB family)
MRLLVVVALVVGCRSEQHTAPPKQEPAAERKATEAQGSAAIDPWATPPRINANDPPTFTERHRFANEACPTVTGPYFFRIEKGGKTSHILGTRHLGVSLEKMPKPVHDAIASAKLAVFEVAPGDASDLPETTVVLRDALGPDLYKRYAELVGEQTAEALETAPPSAALVAIMVTYEDITARLDEEIQREMKSRDIPTRGLEAAEFQDGLLDKILDLRMLRSTIEQTKDRNEIRETSRKNLVAYCAGTDEQPGLDDEDRADLLASGYTKAEVDQIDEDMVYTRNADWIPKLEKILERSNVFIAVGADHLTGPRGVVALLEKRGYKLTRVMK